MSAETLKEQINKHRADEINKKKNSAALIAKLVNNRSGPRYYIVQRFCEVRIERGLTLRDAAKLLGYKSQSTLYFVECGRHRAPDRVVVRMLRLLEAWGE